MGKENKGLKVALMAERQGKNYRAIQLLVCRFSSCETHLGALFKYSVCVCVYVYMHVHVCARVWKPEENLNCSSLQALSVFFFFFFKDKVSLTK